MKPLKPASQPTSAGAGDDNQAPDQRPSRTAAQEWPSRQQSQIADQAEPDFLPVVKLFTPDAGCTWPLPELDPEDPDIAFGLCDLGIGCPELG